jgi:DNA-binding response OmpR family regulator
MNFGDHAPLPKVPKVKGTKIGLRRWGIKGRCRERKDQMAQRSPAHRRALIVEDEIMIAMGLEADMHALGFDICDLAADARDDQPDVVLVDVNLEGGREGIEVATRLREECDVPIVFVTGCTDRDTVERIHKQVPGAPVLPKPVWGNRLDDAVAAVMTFRMW